MKNLIIWPSRDIHTSGKGWHLAKHLILISTVSLLAACGGDSKKTYQVTAGAGSGGTITPATQKIDKKSTATMTVSANSGFVIDKVSGCGGSLTGNTYTTGAITNHCAVIATFLPVTPLTVTAAASTGGSVTPATQTVANGASTTVTVTPDNGFNISQVSGCNGSLTDNIYTTGPISTSCTVVAVFSTTPIVAPITVSAVATTGGSITPASQAVASGASTTVTVTPDSGYSIDQVIGCDGSLAGNTYTTGAVASSCIVIATFSPTSSITVSATAGTGGSITPASQNVASGETVSMTVTADTGYSIGQVTGCGGSLAGNTYTTGPVTANCLVTAAFNFTQQVTASTAAGAGGSISPSSRVVNQGENTTFTVTPSSGFLRNTVSGCGGSLAGSTYTTSNLFVNCTVTATFVAARVATASAGTGGTILPASRTVADGLSTTFTVTPSTGYVIDGISGCNGSLSGSTYTTGNLNANCAISVSFRSVATIFAGGSHTCAIFDPSDMKCWGQNSSGQLGVSSFSLTAHGDEAGEHPGDNPSVSVAGALTFQSVELGTQHSCAVMSDQNAYCWGESQNGQLGLGINADRKNMTLPVDLGGEAVAEVSAGGQFSCARLVNNEVYCWGLNSSGELGIGSNETQYVPSTPVGLSGVPAQLASGAAHNCARMTNNTVQCWGDNSSGQLGDNNGGVDSSTPSNVTVPPGTITDIASGGLFSCIIIDSDVHCWGENGSGQLGNNDGTNTDLDVLTAALDIDGETPVKLALGGEHACVLTATGLVYCWGESDAGQTGQNDTTDDLAPLVVSTTGYTVTGITAGNDHVCVNLLPDDNLNTDRPIRCWGEGGVGQLGHENTSDIGDDEVVDSDAYNVFPHP